jgi:hypothetical protein
VRRRVGEARAYGVELDEPLVGELELAAPLLELRRPVADPLLELLVDAHVLHGDRRRVGERLQELDLVSRRPVRRRPVVPDRADRVDRPHRDHQQALDERRPVGVVRDPVVAVDVLDGSRLAVQHHPAADARAEGEVLPLPERRDRVLVGVIAPVALAQDERGAVGARQPPCGASHDRLHVRDGARERELLDGVDQHADLLAAAAPRRRSSRCARSG